MSHAGKINYWNKEIMKFEITNKSSLSNVLMILKCKTLEDNKYFSITILY